MSVCSCQILQLLSVPLCCTQVTHVLFTGNLWDHPQEGEGQEVHGGNERTVLEPAAGRAPAQRLAQRPAGDSGRPHPAQPHRHAAGLRGGDPHLLRRRADQAPRLPLCLHPGAVSRLLDRRGGQHHPLLHMSCLKVGTSERRSTIKLRHELTQHRGASLIILGF